jgi:hypothetical protein
MARKYSNTEIDYILNNYKTKSNYEMGKKIGLSRDAMRSKLRRLGIKRTPEEIRLNYKNNKNRCAHYGVDHPLFGKHRTEEVKEKIKNKLKGVPRPQNRITLAKYKKDFGSWNKGLPPEKQVNWKGGLSKLPYSFNFDNVFKKSIRIRDGLICIKCGMKEEDSVCLFKRALHVHHINYNKKDTVKENCCALCNRCNSEVNFNRSSWTKFFQSLLTERYDYQYNDKGEVIQVINIQEGLS